MPSIFEQRLGVLENIIKPCILKHKFSIKKLIAHLKVTEKECFHEVWLLTQKAILSQKVINPNRCNREKKTTPNVRLRSAAGGAVFNVIWM